MRAADFNAIPKKRESARKPKRVLSVLPADIEVFVCRPLNGARITRASCRKMAENPPSIGPCGKCMIGASHVRGRLPGTWPDGQPIEFTTIHVAGTSS
jgi:hypothetical protein